MSINNTRPQARHDSYRFHWTAIAATYLAGLLVACGGGGGSDTGSTDIPAPAVPPITRTDAQPGDYFVYAITQTTSVPTGGSPSTYNQIVTYHSIAADGANQRVSTYGNGIPAQPNTYDVNAAWVSQDASIGGTGVVCSNTPASQVAPPYPRSVGQTWGNTSVRTCGTTATTVTQSGQIVARETIALPAGSFDSHRAERTAVSVSAASTVSQQLTCWYSVQRGVLLRCDYTNTTTPAGSTTPSSVASVTQVLSALGGPARVAQGAVLPRFQGAWRVQYSGDASGSCSQLSVASGGGISGSCTATGGASFTVTGSVTDSGAVTISLPTGGVLSGMLGSPYAGSGSWVDSGLSGTWTATHN